MYPVKLMTTKGNYGPMVAILNSDPLKPQHFKTHKQIKQFQHFFISHCLYILKKTIYSLKIFKLLTTTMQNML